jgi:hypothetical protein
VLHRGSDQPGLLNDPALYRLNIMLLMLAVVGSLVLVHNLYVGADPQARQMLRWPALALAAVWVFELNLYTVAYLDTPGRSNWLRSMACSMWALRCILALGAMKGREPLR